MLSLRVDQLLTSRGIKSKIKYLMSLGFSYNTARHINSGNVRYLNLATVEKLCIGLRCTPNDIMSYVPGGKYVAAPEDPLMALNDDRFSTELVDSIAQMTDEERAWMKEQLRALKNKKNIAP